MDIRQLRHFIAVAETLNFRRASELLEMAQPPLSQSIRRLEHDLGVRLLDRTNRSVKLTPAGSAFLDESRQTVAQLDRAISVARNVGSGRADSLRIAYGSSSSYTFLPETIRRFRKERPDVDLELCESTSIQMVELIAADRIDIGLLRPVIDLNLRFQAELIYRERLIAVLPSDHAAVRQDELHLSHLADDPFIVSALARNPSTIHQKTLMACREAGFSPQIAQVAGQYMETTLGMVAAGLGVALMPGVISTVTYPGVVFRHLIDQSSYLDVELYSAQRKGKASPVIRAFLDVARDVGASLYKRLHG